MTVPMAEGKLYEVDMRLRPSGNKGPVATHGALFKAIKWGSWIWEHLALSRARVIAGPQRLGRRSKLSHIVDGANLPEAAKRVRPKCAAHRACQRSSAGLGNQRRQVAFKILK